MGSGIPDEFQSLSGPSQGLTILGGARSIMMGIMRHPLVEIGLPDLPRTPGPGPLRLRQPCFLFGAPTADGFAY